MNRPTENRRPLLQERKQWQRQTHQKQITLKKDPSLVGSYIVTNAI